VIRLQDEGEDRTWSEDERLAVLDVAGQVGVALETARLFEKTTQRADRERKVLEISGRIRATTDPQEMLEIAAAELQKALGATRTQIFLSQPPQPPAVHSEGRNGNGKGNGNGHKEG
jgi:GAF domain-containing protein